MKKIVAPIIMTTLITLNLSAEENTVDVNNMQQKTNYILIKKVSELEAKVKTLKHNQNITNMEIKKIKEKLLISNDIIPISGQLPEQRNSSTTNTKKRGANESNANQGNTSAGKNKHAGDDVNTAEKSISKYISKKKLEKKLKDIYLVNKNVEGYKKSEGNEHSNKTFKKGSYVFIVVRRGSRYLTQSGVWINKNVLTGINSDILKGGNFYTVSTYMANSREGAGVNNEIESVFYKNDLLFITGSKETKEKSVWKKIKNNGYINSRIIKPISY